MDPHGATEGMPVSQDRFNLRYTGNNALFCHLQKKL